MFVDTLLTARPEFFTGRSRQGIEKAAFPFQKRRPIQTSGVYFIVVDIPLALNRNSAFPGVLSYQNSFSGSKFVVIGGLVVKKCGVVCCYTRFCGYLQNISYKYQEKY